MPKISNFDNVEKNLEKMKNSRKNGDEDERIREENKRKFEEEKAIEELRRQEKLIGLI